MMPDEPIPADDEPPAAVPPDSTGNDSPADSAVPPAVPASPVVADAHAAGPEPASWSWPSIHPEGYKFAGIAGAVTLLGFFFEWQVVPWLTLAVTIFILAFFRDPRRASPADGGLLLSPADGLVSQIMTVALPRQLVAKDGLAAGEALRISIFMSVFDVHINRTPIAGQVQRIVYVPGAFLNASLDKASEDNERQYFVVEAADGTRVGFTQIAGLVARRILSFVHVGDAVTAGQRVGLIRFGSRVDVFLPADFTPQVVKGQKAVAGETVLAARGRAAVTPGPRA